MSRYLIATMPITGHVLPALPIARKLVERGHEVAWYTGNKFQGKIEATGARYFPMVSGYDFDDADMNTAFPGRASVDGLEQLKFDMKHVFIDAIAGHLQDIENILRGYHADVITGDTAFVAGMLASELYFIPWAVFNITVLGSASRDTAPFGLGILPADGLAGRLRNRFLYWMAEQIVLRDVYRYLKQTRDTNGWIASGKDTIPVISPYLYLQPTVPGFEYNRSDLPAQVHFIGPLLPPAPKDFTPPVWWDDVTSGKKPVILVTQGTIATDANQLVAPALKALANEDVVVVATADAASLNVDIPANAHVVPFIPFASLMPYVSAMVTNGGYGGVTIALANGVPVIAGGITEDKPEVNNRIAYAGVGINLRTATPTPEQVLSAVKEVLSNSRYHHNARHMSAELTEYDAPTHAARLLEKLALTKRPVIDFANAKETAEFDAAEAAWM
jgi:MGT family glycosyltransferase